MATGTAHKFGSAAGGLMVAGKSKSDRFDSEAFEWTGDPVAEDDGIDHLCDLEYILSKTGAGKLSGMESERNLNEATGFRPQAARSLAEAVNPERNVEAWMAKLQNINKGESVTMKNSIRIVLVGLATIMIFAAVQASGGMEVKKGPGGPNVDTLELEVVSGCVLSLHDDRKDGITICSDIVNLNEAPICPEVGNDDCNECVDGNVTTILGIGPAFYWENAVTLEIDDSNCLPITDESEQYTVMEATSAIPQPRPGDNVAIGYYPCLEGEDLIALWVVVKTNGGVSAVLLRNQETLEVLWKAIGKNRKGKKKPNSED